MIDKENSKDLLEYLARATDKTRTQIHAQQELAVQLAFLSQNETNDLQNKMNLLNKKVREKTNKNLLRECQLPESFQDRLVSVEQKINAYTRAEQLRSERIEELEEKMKLRSMSNAEKAKTFSKTKKTLSLLQAQVARLGKNKKSIALKERIFRVKEYLKSLQ
ncbi:MAG: hypothetical protein Q7K43_06770 [Candidatus Woesearchaeota archaeon]|nr:hypothetical protein [Candidatus Woesearchaeota archaeon]